jgi:DNA-binding transcriptional regulator YiaG
MQNGREKEGEPKHRGGNRRSAVRTTVSENSGVGRSLSPDRFYLAGKEVVTAPYRYRACGLDGMFLLNGYVIEEHDGEVHVAISDIDGLHKTIGRHLVRHRKALSPKEVRFLRNTLDLTQAELAARLGNTSQSVARWEKGECEMPGAAEKLLRAIFLVSVMTNEDLDSLKDLLSGTDLDQKDETRSGQAQFKLFDSWVEKEAA